MSQGVVMPGIQKGNLRLQSGDDRALGLIGSCAPQTFGLCALVQCAEACSQAKVGRHEQHVRQMQ